MLAVVCFYWNDGNRDYRAEYVNKLASGFRKYLSIPHRFICVTDQPEGLDSHVVDVLPLPAAARDAARLLTPHGPDFPSSYRRLWAFSVEAKSLGDRILMTDVDCMVTGQVDPLIEYMDETGADFVGWRPPSTWNGVIRVAGGNWLLKTGTKSFVWDTFGPKGLQAAARAGQRGSDQAWISHCLASDCVVWPKGHGIYEAQWMRVSQWRLLPPCARIVHFNGRQKPWHPEMQKIDWIRERWHREKITA